MKVKINKTALMLGLLLGGSLYGNCKQMLKNRKLQKQGDNKFKEGMKVGEIYSTKKFENILKSGYQRDCFCLLAYRIVVYVVKLQHWEPEKEFAVLDDYLRLINSPGLHHCIQQRLRQIRYETPCIETIYMDMDELMDGCDTKERLSIRSNIKQILDELVMIDDTSLVKDFYDDWCKKYK